MLFVRCLKSALPFLPPAVHPLLRYHTSDDGGWHAPTGPSASDADSARGGLYGTGSGGERPVGEPPNARLQRPRLTVLVSSADWRAHTVADQLPPLLQPMGIQCVAASSGEEAQQLIRRVTIHIAVIDLAIPLHARPSACSPGATPNTRGEQGDHGDDPAVAAAQLAAAHAARAEAGARLLQLLRRMESPPPVIVVRPPQPSLRDSARGMSDALREGAFAVLDRPVQLEAMLEALHRIVRRHYPAAWNRV